LIVDRVQTLAGLRQELPQQIVHGNRPSNARRATSTRPFSSAASFYAKRLILIEQMEKNALNKEITRPTGVSGRPLTVG
jgi:hypothetical protein